MRTRRALAATILFAAIVAATGATAAPPSLAVFSLHPLNMDAVGDDAEIYYSLTQALSKTNAASILPRREVEDKLRVAGMPQARDRQGAQAAGRLLGVGYVLYGDVSREGSRISTKVHLVDVSTGRLVKTWNTMFTGFKSIAAGCANLADEISGAMKRGPGTTYAPASAPREYRVDNFQATSKGDQVLLTWHFDPKDPITGFTVSRSDNKDGPFRFLGKSKKNSFLDNTARLGGAYYYRLVLNLADGSTRQAPNLAHIKDVGEKVPSPPLVLGAKGLIRRAEIEFAPSLMNMKNDFDITAYRLYRRKPDSEDFELVAEIRPQKSKSLALKATETGLVDGQVLEYSLTSLDDDGKESPRSEAAKVEVPAVPELTVARDGLLRKVDLAWTPLMGVQGYYLYRRGPVGDWQRVAKIADPKAGSYTDVSDLDDGLAYAYALSAYDSQAETGRSGEAAAETKPLPEPPADLKAQSGQVLKVTLAWTPDPDPDVGGYEIFRGPSAKSLERVATVNGHEASSYVDQGRPPFEVMEHGTTYHYAVRAVNLHGAPGKISHSADATTKARPRTPANLEAENSGGGVVVVRWDKNEEPDIDSYKLSRSWVEGFWHDLATVPPDVNVYLDRDVSPGKTYTYRLTAVDADGLSSDTAESGNVRVPE